MSINLYDLYKRKTRKYGVNYSQDTFKETFVDAVNLVYSEMNEKVFQANQLEMIGSFGDVIDDRLASFSTITHDTVGGSDEAVGGREYWSAEYEFERMSGTNGFLDTLDSTANVTLAIADNVFTINGNAVVGTADISGVADVFKLKFTSDSEGNRLEVDGDEIELAYTTGDADTSQAIGTLNSHVVSGVAGLELTRMRFLSAGTVVYDFLMDDGTGSTLTDSIALYTATVASPVWEVRYIEPSTGLDERYRSALEYGLDWHLQDGGVWGLEDDADRERKWYRRGIASARRTNQQLTTYKSPLNPRGL